MRGVRILITGGAGFIGSHVADLLAADGHSVLLLDAFLPQAHGSGAPPEWSGKSGPLLLRSGPEILSSVGYAPGSSSTFKCQTSFQSMVLL